MTPSDQHCFEFSLCKDYAIVVANLQRIEKMLMTLQERNTSLLRHDFWASTNFKQVHAKVGALDLSTSNVSHVLEKSSL